MKVAPELLEILNLEYDVQKLLPDQELAIETT
jgi:hypothetical protein